MRANPQFVKTNLIPKKNKKFLKNLLTTAETMLYYNCKEREEKIMTREQLVKRIAEVENAIMYEECAELGYRSDVVRALKVTLRELRTELAKLD